ncbi:MAG: response regulator [Bradyrhizobium sp.]|uniref:response regulator n=1 Tax=Bradyrhizobium sp. TaxID=376 RepID=UPI001D947DA6|nr:response regulator [Bradyrhizobium sp.]MBV9564716.1 response regulator [Bradyrhizobium sp.]
MRVLVVEDDALIREIVVEALREEGFDVIQAADGDEALEWCRRRFADVLVTDVRLPGTVDGWQIAERCREHHPDLPVIYATGFSPVAPRPVAGGVFLQKPFHPDEIVKAVRQVTETSMHEGRRGG